MHPFYPFRTYSWMHKILQHCIWKLEDCNSIALTFDDGPHPSITPWVLSMLSKYNIKATFFLIGENVQKYPQIVSEILEHGHHIGGHTTNHLHYFKTQYEVYEKDVLNTQNLLDTKLFRPPYGKLSYRAVNKLLKKEEVENIVMWTLLSGDFDKNLSAQYCLEQLIQNVRGGDVIVFHDSEKAWERLSEILEPFIQFLLSKNFEFKCLS